MVDDVQPYRPGEQPTLHEILVADKLDFEAKVQRAVKRKKWLKGEIISLFLIISYIAVLLNIINACFQQMKHY